MLSKKYMFYLASTMQQRTMRHPGFSFFERVNYFGRVIHQEINFLQFFTGALLDAIGIVEQESKFGFSKMVFSAPFFRA